MPPLGGLADSYLNMKKSFHKKRGMHTGNKGHPEKYYLKLGDLYEDIDNAAIFVRSVAGF